MIFCSWRRSRWRLVDAKNCVAVARLCIGVGPVAVAAELDSPAAPIRGAAHLFPGRLAIRVPRWALGRLSPASHRGGIGKQSLARALTLGDNPCFLPARPSSTRCAAPAHPLSGLGAAARKQTWGRYTRLRTLCVASVTLGCCWAYLVYVAPFAPGLHPLLAPRRARSKNRRVACAAVLHFRLRARHSFDPWPAARWFRSSHRSSTGTYALRVPKPFRHRESSVCWDFLLLT